MPVQRRGRLLGVAQLVWTVVLAVVVFTEPKHHASAVWIAADVAVVLVLMAIGAASFTARRRQMRRDGRIPAFRRSALLPVLVVVVIAFVIQRLVG